MYNGAAKQVSAGVVPFNKVGFVQLFRISVASQVSRKVEQLSTSPSATARNGRSDEKRKSFTVLHHFMKLVSQRRCTQVSVKFQRVTAA